MMMFDDHDAFCNWLAGFIDGEGSFNITATRGGGNCAHRCQMSLGVRADDAPIIEEIVDRLGFGTIQRVESGKYGVACPQIRWNVQGREDAAALVTLLDEYPLRAKKAKDYAIWREAVLEWVSVPPRKHRDWTRLAILKQELENQRRAYGARHLALAA